MVLSEAVVSVIVVRTVYVRLSALVTVLLVAACAVNPASTNVICR
jgi:hypothetical protein